MMTRSYFMFFVAVFGVLGFRAQSIELFGFERQVQSVKLAFTFVEE